VTRVVVRPEAETDLQSAFDWYEQRRVGLGMAFREAVNGTIARIAESPRAYPVRYRELRRALVQRFPYAVYYRPNDDVIVVVAVVHGSRHERVWKSRA
jgi:plasmid stabilization system protein ParE